jgi:hypothetical protein
LILAGFLLAFPLGLLSKENAFLTIPSLLAIELLVLRVQVPAVWARRAFRLIVGVFMVLPLALAVAYFGVKFDDLTIGYLGRSFDLYERLLTQVHVLWMYLKLIFVPIPGAMGIFHDGFPIQRSLDLLTLLAALALLALPVLALALRRVAPLVSLGILWFFIWHTLESTVLPLELVFEHRNYLALLGPALALTSLLQQVQARVSLRRITRAAAAAALLLLALNTLSRAETWGDVDLLAANEFQHHPNSPRAATLLMRRAVANGRTDILHSIFEDLDRRSPNVAVPLLMALNLRCQSEGPTKALLKEIRERFSSSIARPGDVEQLRLLAKNVSEGRCPFVSSDDLLELAADLAGNRRVHTITTRVGALNLHARLAARHARFDDARDSLRQSIPMAARLSPTWLKATIDIAAEAASYHATYDDAIAFIEEVARGSERSIYANDIVVNLTLKPQRGPNADAVHPQDAP